MTIFSLKFWIGINFINTMHLMIFYQEEILHGVRGHFTFGILGQIYHFFFMFFDHL